MNSTNEDIHIYGKLVNVSTEGIVADAASIWCERYKKTVEDVIKDVNDKYLPLAGGTMDGGIISPSYKKIGGTGEQILLADGSVATTINTDTLNSILN